MIERLCVVRWSSYQRVPGVLCSLLAAIQMSSAATEANAGARVDDPLLAWAGTITGDLQLSFGDPAAGAVSATVTGGANAPFELSLGRVEIE